MTADKALSSIRTIINNTLQEYDQSPDSKTTDATGAVVRIPHALDIVSDPDIVFTLDMAVKDVALKAIPISLIETTGSTASELRRVSTDYFIRVPSDVVLGTNLDIDDGLSYAVLYKTLAMLWRDYGDYEQKADSIINTYLQAYKKYIADLILGIVSAGAETYIRFSSDGTSWHSSFTTGDTYISFKRIDTQTWTPAIQFVGSDGVQGIAGTPCSDTLFTALSDTPTSYVGNGAKVVAVNATETALEFIPAPTGGTGSSTFAGLTDTPTTYVADQYVKVNPAGTALEFVPAPTGGAVGANLFGDNPTYDGSATGTITLDASTNNVFYLNPTANAVISFTPFTDGGATVSALWGTTYTFMIVSNGATAITFDPAESILGDNVVGLGTLSPTTNITMTILKMVYTGYDWYVVSKNVITDANG